AKALYLVLRLAVARHHQNRVSDAQFQTVLDQLGAYAARAQRETDNSYPIALASQIIQDKARLDQMTAELERRQAIIADQNEQLEADRQQCVKQLQTYYLVAREQRMRAEHDKARLDQMTAELERLQALVADQSEQLVAERQQVAHQNEQLAQITDTI